MEFCRVNALENKEVNRAEIVKSTLRIQFHLEKKGNNINLTRDL